MGAIARVGDPVVVQHSTIGSNMTKVATGSSDVFAEGKAISRVGDMNEPHFESSVPSAQVHTTSLVAGSPDVYVNGIAMARVGDIYSCGSKAIQGAGSAYGNG